MPRTNVVGTTAAAGSGAQRCAQACERERGTGSTTVTAATIAARTSSPPAIAERPTPIRAEVTFALRDGHTRTPLALVVRDLDWPGMWRIAWPDGRLSDLVNLPRAKDAAEAISERGPPARNRRLFDWHTSKTPRGAPSIAPNGQALPEQPSSENNASVPSLAEPLQKTPSAGERAWR